MDDTPKAITNEEFIKASLKVAQSVEKLAGRDAVLPGMAYAELMRRILFEGLVF